MSTLLACLLACYSYMFHKKGGVVESYISHFVFCLGVARLLHLVTSSSRSCFRVPMH